MHLSAKHRVLADRDNSTDDFAFVKGIPQRL